MAAVRAAAAGSRAAGGFAGGGDQVTSALTDYLVANQGSATWLVAVSGANEAGSIQLATGLPVMAMGGFTGSDPAPTLAEFQAYVASGELRYVLVGGGGGGRGGPGGFGGASSDVSSWVQSACTAVDVSGASGSLYDCAGAVAVSAT